ncbi:hypothetical protein WPS_20750 [Vulcanimicrobium alpinum]|uniref:GGDEF domain-containing protein n=1 Tax=Vulcanimicrobium alpinum TaxID=3016050 RepID=A0AAN1XWT8_UNVUL|nr:GGDEF domain-containing protein [Vulcanimicrobium alpinum]BDE06799.1 hypothetical protein WPS_20750 [Vulcanimicrobium alpinum]
MAPLASHLVGYLSMFLQLGILAMLAGLAAVVRASLGRRMFDGWTVGLLSTAAGMGVLAATALLYDLPALGRAPMATMLVAALEDAGVLYFIAAIRHERRRRLLNTAPVAAFALAIVGTAVATLLLPTFIAAYRVHTALLAMLFAFAAFESMRGEIRGLGAGLLTVALSALAIDYLHLPLLALAGVQFAPSYPGLESYLTVALDIVLGVAIVVQATDAARGELEERNAALARAERLTRDAVYVDPLCRVANRAAFMDRIAQPPPYGAVAMIDLDGLKRINDRLGHAAGDAALTTAARALRNGCGECGTIYRIGGDEFAGVWIGLSAETVDTLIEAIAREMGGTVHDPAPVRLSWGVASFGPQRPFNGAIVAADAQLYDRRAARAEHYAERRRPGIETKATPAARTQTITDAPITARNPAR